MKPIGSTSIEVGSNPSTGFQVSTDPGVMWSLFPGDATDIRAVFSEPVPHELSTMRITSPFDGPNYVATTVGVSSPADLQRLRGFEWTDGSGSKWSYLPYDENPLQGFTDPDPSSTVR